MNKISFTKKELLADVKFLSGRIHLAGCFSMSDERSWGSSSNSLCEIAYGLRDIKDVIMPCDNSDLNACTNLLVLLPIHRKIKNKDVYRAYDLQKKYLEDNSNK